MGEVVSKAGRKRKTEFKVKVTFDELAYIDELKKVTGLKDEAEVISELIRYGYNNLVGTIDSKYDIILKYKQNTTSMRKKFFEIAEQILAMPIEDDKAILKEKERLLGEMNNIQRMLTTTEKMVKMDGNMNDFIYEAKDRRELELKDRMAQIAQKNTELNIDKTRHLIYKDLGALEASVE